MRIVIDLQGAQSASRFRGIGRYSLALALGVARNAGEHEVWLLMNAALSESVDPLRQAFAGLVPPTRMRVFDSATPCAESHLPQQWRTRVNERTREYVLDRIAPDVVLVTSLFEGYVDDAVVSVGAWRGGMDTAVVLYDLIPFLNPAAYLPAQLQQDYYARKIASLRAAGLLLSISDYSRQEALDALGLPAERIVSISTAVDERFHPAVVAPQAAAALRARYGITRDFVLCAPGGFDRRKNIDGLISAWSLLGADARARHQLVIASKLDRDEHQRLLAHAAQCGVAPAELLWTDYVEDDTLIDLYRCCALFVFPSRHEGFGLPALEAMACGALVIGGDNTSIPEVIGSAEALFNADDPRAIAERIGAALSDLSLRERLRENGRARAPLFSWDASAVRAIRALEALYQRPRPAPPARTRRKLAFVSPLPPERTGIADYAAQCLPALREHFDITLVTRQDKVVLPPEAADLPRQDAAWFAGHAGEFDQIIYQFGNSPFHSHMFALLQRFPGVVVLHDFYLSSVLAYEQMTGAMPGVFTGALAHSHGYAALQQALEPGGLESSKLAYPCNLDVLQGATEVIVHSAHALQLARQWYGREAGANWHVVPLPRSAPAAQDRAAARRALGIGDDAFVVCSFGFVDASKLSHRLLDAWRDSALCADAGCELVFVGANHGGAYGKELLDAINAINGTGKKRIRIAGWTEEAQYHQYLRAADVGVQLRSISRGETSAAVLDCMNYGLATIVNANGSMAALADDAVWKLPDEFSTGALTEALETLHRDGARRRELGARAAARIDGEHRPEHAAVRYAQVLDQAMAAAPRGQGALVEAVARLAPPDDAALQQVAAALARAVRMQPQPRQLLVDVTNIVRNDLGTGIERVVRMQLIELLRASAHALRVEPVYLSSHNGRWHYRYVPRYAHAVLGISAHAAPDSAIDVHPGDILYAPDYAPQATCDAARAGVYADLRAHGVSLNFLIHDLLPVLRPEFFPPGADAPHAAWLECIAGEADRLVCISQAVADETRDWLATRRLSVPSLHVLHHGADFAGAAPDAPGALPENIASAPSFLMVGTIEPRKGHLQALDAFEALWQAGVEANLVIVGKEGWGGLPDAERRTIPTIIRRLTGHPQTGKRLFWMKGIDDATLQQLYRDSACLLAPSEGEGFGLPLIEAAHFGLPIIARDIPVFREVLGEHARYFSGLEGAQLARAVRDWLELRAAGGAPRQQLQWRTWRDNAAQLLGILAPDERPA